MKLFDAKDSIRYYLYGAPFIIKTDHQPLIWLTKNLYYLFPKIQRLEMKLLRCSFDVTDKEMLVETLRKKLKVYSVLVTIPKNEKILIEAIAGDKLLRDVKKITYWMGGLPTTRRYKKFLEIRDEMYLQSDVLFFCKKLKIPFSLRIFF